MVIPDMTSLQKIFLKLNTDNGEEKKASTLMGEVLFFAPENSFCK
jgi:hypothetical protein